MDHKKIAYFNCTGTEPNIGSLAVAESQLGSLLKLGYNIAYIYNPQEIEFLKSGNRKQSLYLCSQSKIAYAIEECDAVVINGEDSIRNNSHELLTIAECAQKLDKPVFLVNCAIHQIDGYDDVLEKLADLAVLDAHSSNYLGKKNIPHRIVLSSILDAGFSKIPVQDFTNKIICTDWHPQKHADSGITTIRYIERNAVTEEFIFMPLSHWSYIENANWKYFVANLKTAKCMVSGSIYGVYMAGMAGMPFVALPADSSEIEGLIELSGLNLPITSNIHDLESKVTHAINNPELFKEFQNFLLGKLPLSTFTKLAQIMPTKSVNDYKEIDLKLGLITSGLYSKALARQYDARFKLLRNDVIIAAPNILVDLPSTPNNLLMQKIAKFESAGEYKKIIEILEPHLAAQATDHAALYHYALAKMMEGELVQGLKYCIIKVS